jgi:hypothetical protein
MRISQEQGVRKETKDNGGFETEHQGRSGSNFSQHAARVKQNFQKRLGKCVDKGRHLTDIIFRK